MERSRGGRALKAIHTLSHAHGMQYAVKLHRENTQGANCPPLAWTCSVTVSCLWKSSVLLFHLHYPVRLSEFGQSVSIVFLFVCFNVGIHSCLPQLGLWNFKIFSPRSTVVFNFYLVQNFDISKIKRHLKNLWHSAAKIVFVVGCIFNKSVLFQPPVLLYLSPILAQNCLLTNGRNARLKCPAAGRKHCNQE